MSRRLVISLLVALAATLPHAALAQGTPVDAEELFKQGRAALEAGDYAVACQKLDASLRIERAVGTLMSLAKCEEATNKLASAREHWQEAGDLADASYDRLKRGPACRAKFTELDPRVPRLTIRVVAGSPGDPVVKRDGVVLVAAALNTPMPVDPGPHTVEVSAAGHDTQALSVELAEGQSKSVDASPGPANKAVEATRARGSQAMGPIFWSGVGVAGAGVLVGVIAGAMAVSKGSALSGACPKDYCSSATGQSDYNAARSMSLTSDIGFAIAGAGAVVAVVGFLTHRRASAEPPATSLWLGPASVGVLGTF
jgi:hypothetical protein